MLGSKPFVGTNQWAVRCLMTSTLQMETVSSLLTHIANHLRRLHWFGLSCTQIHLFSISLWSVNIDLFFLRIQSICETKSIMKLYYAKLFNWSLYAMLFIILCIFLRLLIKWMFMLGFISRDYYSVSKKSFSRSIILRSTLQIWVCDSQQSTLRSLSQWTVTIPPRPSYMQQLDSKPSYAHAEIGSRAPTTSTSEIESVLVSDCAWRIFWPLSSTSWLV